MTQARLGAVFESGERLIRGWGNPELARAIVDWPHRWCVKTLDAAMDHPEAFAGASYLDAIDILDRLERVDPPSLQMTDWSRSPPT